MKKIILTFFFCITLQGVFAQTIGDKQLFEKPLPPIWSKVEKIYVWIEDDYLELQIKKAPMSASLIKNSNLTITCNYLFDILGNKISSFLIHLPEFSYNEKVLQSWEKPDSELDVFRVALMQEVIDEEGKVSMKIAGKIEGVGLVHPEFIYYSGTMIETPFGVVEDIKTFEIAFNKDKTKVFLHSKY